MQYSTQSFCLHNSIESKVWHALVAYLLGLWSGHWRALRIVGRVEYLHICLIGAAWSEVERAKVGCEGEIGEQWSNECSITNSYKKILIHQSIESPITLLLTHAGTSLPPGPSTGRLPGMWCPSGWWRHRKTRSQCHKCIWKWNDGKWR